MSRSSRATARYPFGHYQEFELESIVENNPLQDTIWTSSPCKDMQVNWDTFFQDTPHYLAIFQKDFEDSYRASEFSSAGYLVGASINLFRGMRQLDATPTFAEAATRLRFMRRALARFAAVSQGLSVNAEILAEPHWLAMKPKRLVIGMQTSWIASLHPVLQTILETADEPQAFAETSNDKHQQNFEAYKARQNMLLGFFTMIPEVLDHLDQATTFSEVVGQRQPRPRFKGAPGDP